MSRPPGLPSALRGGRLLIALVVAFGLLAGVARALTYLYVEVLWQAQAGYLAVFWKRVAWEWGTQLVAGLVVAGLVFLNLRIAATTLGGIQIRRRFGNLEISEQIPRRYVTWSLLSAAAIIGLWFGASVPAGIGRRILLALSAPAWGETPDPVLGRDLGFYVFWFPVLGGAISYAMIVAFLVFTLATAGYAATGAVSWVRGQFRAHAVARMHLGGILAAFFLLLGMRLWLGRYGLLIDGSSAVQGIFGYTDHQARLPALQTMAVLCFAAALATGWGAARNRLWPLLASFGAVVLGTVLIGNVYPYVIQSFRVEPNELARETPYIEHSLEYTRSAYGLGDMRSRSFAYDANAPVDWAAAAEQFAGLPVWGPDPLLTTFEEIDARFSYYGFDQVTIDRYPTVDGDTVPVALSVRQIDASGIQDRNWQNVHLRELYVAGMGAVASMATGRTESAGPQMLLSARTPAEDTARTTVAGLELERPHIFFGTHRQDYAIVTPGPDQYRAPDGSPGVPGVDVPQGIRLGASVRKALLAWQFRTANLLFSSEVSDDSRLIYRRRVVERAAAVAPFLRFPEVPYPVIVDGRVIWVLEGFATTATFPLSTRHELGRGPVRTRVRYIRNSVKITVDAVTGDVRLYRVPVEDPLTDAYEAAYPGLIRPMDEMPTELRAHLRYPRSLLDLQGAVLLQYHQETAAAFHGQQDVWERPREFAQGTTEVPYEAEYGIYRLPGDDRAHFNLTTVFVPTGRQNLTAIFAGRTDDAGRPETLLFEVPVQDEVPGPRQIEARVEQDPAISEQFSLWRTGGSEVWTGHLHLVPVGERLLYMEPVFLAAADDALPELRRFVVSDGRRLVMTETLTEAVTFMAGSPLPAGSPLSADDAPGTTPAETASALDAEWPAAALELLERAEERARNGDWQGFGEALERLRALLEALRGPSG